MSAFSIANESETMADNETSFDADPFSTAGSPRWVRIPLTSSLPSFEDDSELLGGDSDPEQDEEEGENPFGDDIERDYQPIPELDVYEDVGLDTSEYSEISATQSLDAERDSGLRTRGRCQGWTYETRTSVRTWTESSSRILSSGPAQQQFMAGVRLPPRMHHDMSAGQAYGMPAHPMSPTDTSMHHQTPQQFEMGGDMSRMPRPPQGMQHPQHHQLPPEMISPQHSMHTRMPHQFMLPSYSGMSEMSQISHGMPQSMVPSRHGVPQLPYGVQTPLHGMQTSPHGMQQAPPHVMQQAPLYAMQQAPPYAMQQTSPHVMQKPPMMSPHHPLMQSGPPSIYPQASVGVGSGGPLASLANFHPSGHHGINTNMGSPVPGPLHQQPPVFLLTMGPDNCLRMNSSNEVPHMAPCLMMMTSSNDHPHMTPHLRMISSNVVPHMAPHYRHMVMRGITPPGSQPSPQMSPQMSHQMSAVMQTQTLQQMDTIDDKSFINSLLVSGSLGVPGDVTMMMEGQPKAQRLYGPGMLHGDPGSFMPLHQQYHMQATSDSGSVVSTPRLTSPMSDTPVSVSSHIKLEPSKDSASADGSVSHDDLVLDLKAEQNELLKHPLGTGNGGWQFPTPDLKENQLKENQLKENQLKENQLKENQLKENLLKELEAQAETYLQQLHNMPPIPLQEAIIDTSQSILPIKEAQSLTGVSTLQGVFCSAYVDGVEDMYGSLLLPQTTAGLRPTVPSTEELAQRQVSNGNKLKLVPDLEACLPSPASKALDEDDYDDMRNYNKQGVIQQSHIQENSPAARCGQLHLGDRIWTVNEVDSSNMHHCKSSHRQGSDDSGEMYQVELCRGSRGFGFSIRGGSEFNSMPLFVLRIAEEGMADLDGRLRVGDQILEVNGFSTDNMTHTEAIEIIQNGRPSIKLLMRRTNKPPPVFDMPPSSPRNLALPSFQMLANSLISHSSPHLARQQLQQHQQPLSSPPSDLQPASNDNFLQLPTTSHADTAATAAEVNNY